MAADPTFTSKERKEITKALWQTTYEFARNQARRENLDPDEEQRTFRRRR